MRIAVVHPGTQWSTSDVYEGLCYGLEQQGVEVVRDAAITRPDAFVVVTGIRTQGCVSDLLRSDIPVTVLFTESPYEQDKELALAANVAGCWTHERTAVDAFRAVNKNVAYLPHAWHPGVHTPIPQPGDEDVPAHDVVFVGSGFRERVKFFNEIDWTGIDLGLYGIWADLGLKPQVEACVRSGPIPNTQAAALYRRAKIGLNLYRRLPFELVRDVPENWVMAESLNPRAYELAACGTCQVTEYRAESPELFFDSVPRFKIPRAAEAWFRTLLTEQDFRRQALGPISCAYVSGHSWTDRASQVLQDLHAWGLVPCLTAQ